VTNSIWKHQYVLKDLDDGLPYLSILFGLINAGKIRVVALNEKFIRQSYSLAASNRASIYDMIFVSLAIELGLELKSLDRQQIRIWRLAKQDKV